MIAAHRVWPFDTPLPGLVLALACASACEEAVPLTIVRCSSDLECAQGQLCEAGACIERDAVSCARVEGGVALLEPTPHALDLKSVSTATITLRNIGTCTLTVFEASLEGGLSGPFSCPGCARARYPIELFPFRDQLLSVSFTPREVGSFTDALVILSDDGEYPELRIPLRGRFDGEPRPSVVPAELDFGYSPVGRTMTEAIHVTNRGTGRAPLVLTDVTIEPPTATAFSLAEGPSSSSTSLLPVAAEAAAEAQIHVRYHPRELGDHRAELVITSAPPVGSIRVPLHGSSMTAPRISVSPDAVDFGPVALGQANVRTLSIQNSGGTPLVVRPRMVGFSNDFSFAPPVLEPIAPGRYAEVQLMVTAATPRSMSAQLALESNDPDRPTLGIPISAEGRPIPGAQVLKIEMTYQNSSSTIFDDDLRNVDMNLESPLGLICGKRERTPLGWGAFGTPTWLAFGANEEPERIVLPNAMQDGAFRVMLEYAEDCSSVPTGVVAAVLGISVDVLVGYFSGGAVPIDGDRVSQVIRDLCVSHSGAAVTVTVYANGEVIGEVPVTLARKGDYTYALDIVRSNGVYHIAPLP